MDIAYALVFLFTLILAPLLAHLRGWSPAALFCAAALAYVALGLAALGQSGIGLVQFNQTDQTYHDTYYVVSRGYHLANTGLGLAVMGLITWAQTRFGAMIYPTLTKVLFWVFHLALVASTFVHLGVAFAFPGPRRYIDYPDFMDTYILAGFWSGHLAQLAFLGLAGLLLWSVAKRLLGRRLSR